jgi:hypothetical protein
MDYRSLRKEFGRDLRLIGGIDLDALRQNKAGIRREIEEKVPYPSYRDIRRLLEYPVSPPLLS